MQRNSSEKRFVAFHEAGHAVTADRYNLDFIATIVGDPQVQLGQIDPEIASIVTIAGPIAQAKFQRRSLAVVYLGHGSDDFRLLQERAVLLNEILPGRQFEVWERSAKLIINQRWMAVQSVAQQLLVCGTLNSSEVRSIVVSSL